MRRLVALSEGLVGPFGWIQAVVAGRSVGRYGIGRNPDQKHQNQVFTSLMASNLVNNVAY